MRNLTHPRLSRDDKDAIERALTHHAECTNSISRWLPHPDKPNRYVVYIRSGDAIDISLTEAHVLCYGIASTLDGQRAAGSVIH